MTFTDHSAQRTKLRKKILLLVFIIINVTKRKESELNNENEKNEYVMVKLQ